MTEKKSKQPFYLIDTDADFYRPFGVRLAICIAATSWAALEIWSRQPFWGIIAGATAVYCVYVLFLTYNPPPKQEAAVLTEEPGEDDNASGDKV
ncbi:MAG: hypothetical protein KDJ87_10280 [Rhizobiaceae bacterium]|nr:hypothetical protein [Rhizobiaceae bacterium]